MVMDENASLRENRLHLSLERGKKFLPWAQCFAIWMPEDCRGSEAVRRFDQIYRCFQREMAANSDLVLPCKTAQDFIQMTRDVMDAGAAGVTYGRFVFQYPHVTPLVKTLGQVVHNGLSVKEAMELLDTLEHEDA